MARMAGHRLRLNREPEARVRKDPHQERRRDEREDELPPLLGGEFRNGSEQAALGGVDGRIDLRGDAAVDDHPVALGVRRLVPAVGDRPLAVLPLLRQAVVQPVVVVRLHEILSHDLPVERHTLVSVHGSRHPVVQSVRLQQVVDLRHPGAERRRIIVEVREDEAAPDLGTQPRKTVVGLVETLSALHGRRTRQRAAEVVDPPVIGTAEGPNRAGDLRNAREPLLPWALGGCGDAHAAVLANRRHHVDRSARLPDHDDGLGAGERRIAAS